jgi:hypothetical protein
VTSVIMVATSFRPDSTPPLVREQGSREQGFKPVTHEHQWYRVESGASTHYATLLQVGVYRSRPSPPPTPYNLGLQALCCSAALLVELAAQTCQQFKWFNVAVRKNAVPVLCTDAIWPAVLCRVLRRCLTGPSCSSWWMRRHRRCCSRGLSQTQASPLESGLTGEPCVWLWTSPDWSAVTTQSADRNTIVSLLADL